MIIGSALGRLFDCMTLKVSGQNVDIRYDYGNQDMLDKFIKSMDGKGIAKFPLVFYVTDKVYKRHNNWKWCRTKLWLFTNTEPIWLAKKRTIETYDNLLNPLYDVVVSKLECEHYFQNMDPVPQQYRDYDIPNIGIVDNKIGGKTSDKSIGNDFIDAKAIDLNFRINTNCINT